MDLLHFLFSFAEIPGFKEITILEVSCEYCPHKANNEVKYIGSNSENVKCNGSSHKNYETKGTRISLNVTENDDLKRKLLKVLELKISCHFHLVNFKIHYTNRTINENSFIVLL